MSDPAPPPEDSGLIALTSPRDVFDMSVDFGSLSDLVVLSVECQTGGRLIDRTAYMDGNGTATIVLGTQWEANRLLVLVLAGMKRVDVRRFGVYSDVDTYVDEEGFRMEFPDGAVISSESAGYRFISY